MLRDALNNAVREELISRNVAALIRAPKPRRMKIRPWSANEARAFLESLRKSGDPLYAAYVLILVLGLRRGEVLALRGEDMDEDGIPEILKTERMGHEMPGMRGVYGHVSPAMRANLKAALQERWEASLRERAQFSPHSIVPVLDKLLATQGQPSTHT